MADLPVLSFDFTEEQLASMEHERKLRAANARKWAWRRTARLNKPSDWRRALRMRMVKASIEGMRRQREQLIDRKREVDLGLRVAPKMPRWRDKVYETIDLIDNRIQRRKWDLARMGTAVANRQRRLEALKDSYMVEK